MLPLFRKHKIVAIYYFTRYLAVNTLGDYQSGDGVRYRELYHRTPPVRRMPDVIIGMENAINLTLRNFKAALPLQRSGGV